MSDQVKFDHLAIGVERWSDGYDPLVTRFGGRWSHGGDAGAFTVCQLIYQHDLRLELITPSGPDGFMRRFIDHDGPGPHHLTFKVPSLDDALDGVARLGIGTLGGRTTLPFWREAFLHPKTAGVGTLLQLVEVDEERLRQQLRGAVPPAGFPGEPAPQSAISWIGLTVESLARSEEIFIGVLGGQLAERDTGWMLIRWGQGHALLVREPGARTQDALTWSAEEALGVGHVLFGPADLGVKKLDGLAIERLAPDSRRGTMLLTATPR